MYRGGIKGEGEPAEGEEMMRRKVTEHEGTRGECEKSNRAERGVSVRKEGEKT